MAEQVEGINHEAVTAWFKANVDPAESPLSFSLVSGGEIQPHLQG